MYLAIIIRIAHPVDSSSGVVMFWTRHYCVHATDLTLERGGDCGVSTTALCLHDDQLKTDPK